MSDFDPRDLEAYRPSDYGSVRDAFNAVRELYCSHYFFKNGDNLLRFDGNHADPLSSEEIAECLDYYPTAQSAWKFIRDQLASGSHGAVYITEGGSFLDIPMDFWRTANGLQALSEGRVSPSLERDFEGEFFVHVHSLVYKAKVALGLLDTDTAEGPDPEPSLLAVPDSDQPRRGRPREVDDVEFYVSALKVIYADGLPETQADLVRQVQQEYAASTGRQVSDGSARRRIALLWGKLDVDAMRSGQKRPLGR